MGTMTITTTAPQDARIVAAFGKHLNLGRNATAAEVKADIINHVRTIVLQQEAAAVVSTAVAANPPTPIDPT